MKVDGRGCLYHEPFFGGFGIVLFQRIALVRHKKLQKLAPREMNLPMITALFKSERRSRSHR